eukprot:108306-Amphidinium_carterae.1
MPHQVVGDFNQECADSVHLQELIGRGWQVVNDLAKPTCLTPNGEPTVIDMIVTSPALRRHVLEVVTETDNVQFRPHVPLHWTLNDSCVARPAIPQHRSLVADTEPSTRVAKAVAHEAILEVATNSDSVQALWQHLLEYLQVELGLAVGSTRAWSKSPALCQVKPDIHSGKCSPHNQNVYVHGQMVKLRSALQMLSNGLETQNHQTIVRAWTGVHRLCQHCPFSLPLPLQADCPEGADLLEAVTRAQDAVAATVHQGNVEQQQARKASWREYKERHNTVAVLAAATKQTCRVAMAGILFEDAVGTRVELQPEKVATAVAEYWNTFWNTCGTVDAPAAATRFSVPVQPALELPRITPEMVADAVKGTKSHAKQARQGRGRTFAKGEWPQWMKVHHVVFLGKPGYETAIPRASTVRPIVLLSHLLKVYTTLRLPLMTQAMHRLPDCICGGSKGKK